VILLYLLEFSRLNFGGNPGLPPLAEINESPEHEAWEPFYRVRADLIDGQRARFNIPDILLENEGKMMELQGAGVFFAQGARRIGDSVYVNSFYLLPSLGLVEACEIQPDIEMRWTIRVCMEKEWKLHCNDLIHHEARVKGIFRIDTRTPYEGIFFLDHARANLKSEEDSSL